MNRKPYPGFRMVPFSMTLSDQWPLTHISRLQYYLTANNSKIVQDRAVLTMADQFKVISDLSNGVIFSDRERPLPDFKVTPSFDAEYLGTRYRHSFNGMLIGTYRCPSQGCHFVSYVSYVGADLRKLYSFSQTPANTAKPRIWASVSRDVPVYSPSFRRVLIPVYPQRASSGWVGVIGVWFCTEVVYTSKTVSVTNPGTIRV